MCTFHVETSVSVRNDLALIFFERENIFENFSSVILRFILAVRVQMHNVTFAAAAVIILQLMNMVRTYREDGFTKLAKARAREHIIIGLFLVLWLFIGN